MKQLVDTPNTTIQGFIANKNCDHFKKIFLGQDHGIIFKNNNLWLFIDFDASSTTTESIVSMEQFKKQICTPHSNCENK